jgi:hypothetical protein
LLDQESRSAPLDEPRVGHHGAEHPVCGHRRVGVFLEEEKDEFQRNLMVQALLGGIGGTLVATTVWGNLEAFVHVPHLQSIWIYPIFWLFVGLSTPVVLWRYR